MRNRTDTIRVAVAETSVIVRSGVVSVLKRISGLTVKPVEVTSPDGLENCLHTDTPDVLLVNPAFGGWFNIEEFRADAVHSNVKCIALNCTLTDGALLQSYDDIVTLYDTIDTLRDKLLEAMKDTTSEDESGEEENTADALSQREREIVVCVVKGMTNKEIAEQLYLSVHTVITHRRNIARKLEIHSAAGLTIYAIVNKLVDISEVKL